MEKRKWKKPQLVVLGKGKPEESVLASCKATQTTCSRMGNTGWVPLLKIGIT